MKRVIIESPYAGEVETNVQYAKAAVMDCLQRGEAPYASHLFFTQDGILNDLNEDERKLGIDAGLAWGKAADFTAIYLDRGVSRGMVYGVENAIIHHRKIHFRSLGWCKAEQFYENCKEMIAKSYRKFDFELS